MMLNEIDRRFTEKGIKTKICFLVYLDLYWPPETERIHNEERFLMMFAPISARILNHTVQKSR